MTAPRSERFRELLVTGLYSGYAPFATGTWGSLVALLLYCVAWLAAGAAGIPGPVFDGLTVAAAAVALALAVRWGPWAISRFKNDDPKPFTLDEFAGQWLALVALPLSGQSSWLTCGVVWMGQFLLFRFFDIAKFPPARQAESLPAGWGITVDDLIAGVFANLAGQLIWRVTPLAGILSLGVSSV